MIWKSMCILQVISKNSKKLKYIEKEKGRDKNGKKGKNDGETKRQKKYNHAYRHKLIEVQTFCLIYMFIVRFIFVHAYFSVTQKCFRTLLAKFQLFFIKLQQNIIFKTNKTKKVDSILKSKTYMHRQKIRRLFYK